MATHEQSDSKHNASESSGGNAKLEQLSQWHMPTNQHAMQARQPGCPFRFLQTQTGVNISQRENDSMLKAGSRGPSLLAHDFHFREKITHFDHERIPERVVHARGSGAHGYFQVYKSLEHLTKADFLCDPLAKTPVFVRFSTVLGSRGSPDTVRDVRGFATKFYTKQGNFDLVGNNIPVFFIQDAIKFPDLVHAGKPEPHNEVPMAQTAHDSFWDFMSLTPESRHMCMWILSDRTIPRSYRMMQGFGVHTFRLVNKEGKGTLVKFHWKPVLGVHSLAWDEANKLKGIDPDFHRKDLWEAIESGNFPEYELGLQIVQEEDEHKFDFDLLDCTKIIPEEEVPVQIVGKLTLNRNPDEFFTHTEQIAFCTQNIVPGVDFTNDPMLLGRNFSYLDTQLIRLGGPNFNEIPINRPIVPVYNNQRDGYHRQTICPGKFNYWPNRSALPEHSNYEEGKLGLEETRFQTFHHYAEKIAGIAQRIRDPKFNEHLNQARLFYQSLSKEEKLHLIQAAQFEVGMCTDQGVKQRMVGYFNEISREIAEQVAPALGTKLPPPVDTPITGKTKLSPAVSQLNQQPTVGTIATRKVAFLLCDGFNAKQWLEISSMISAAGGIPVPVANRKGEIKADDEKTTAHAYWTFWMAKSVLFDAVCVIGGPAHIQGLKMVGETIAFVLEAAKHCKAILAVAEGVDFLADVDGCRLGMSVAKGGLRLADRRADQFVNDQGVVTAVAGGEHPTKHDDTSLVEKAKEAVKSAVTAVTSGGEWAYATGQFIEVMKQHRYWKRHVSTIPA